MDTTPHAGHKDHEGQDGPTLGHDHDHAHAHPAADASVAGLKDPVCGMVVTDQSAHHAEHEGRPVYFCSARCLAKFSAQPTLYTQPAPSAPPVVDSTAGTIYTCPMHPEIRQDHQGSCPKCGMALEPLLPDLDEAENPELVDFRRRFWWTLPLTAVVTLMAMLGHRLG